uniref:Uncharacterized protein n=1 Tax=Salix viminalis TaxID=40686 RepID=A0A6N2KL83_SALVM
MIDALDHGSCHAVANGMSLNHRGTFYDVLVEAESPFGFVEGLCRTHTRRRPRLLRRVIYEPLTSSPAPPSGFSPLHVLFVRVCSVVDQTLCRSVDGQ